MAHIVPDVNNVFTQLTAGLQLVARVKREEPQAEYFHKSTESVRTLKLDGGTYQVVLTKLEEEDQKPAT